VLTVASHTRKTLKLTHVPEITESQHFQSPCYQPDVLYIPSLTLTH